MDGDTDGEKNPVPSQTHACGKNKLLDKKISYIIVLVTCELGVVVVGYGVDVADSDWCQSSILFLYVIDEVSGCLVVAVEAALVDEDVETP